MTSGQRQRSGSGDVEKNKDAGQIETAFGEHDVSAKKKRRRTGEIRRRYSGFLERDFRGQLEHPAHVALRGNVCRGRNAKGGDAGRSRKPSTFSVSSVTSTRFLLAAGVWAVIEDPAG